jgi:hypothetical protein
MLDQTKLQKIKEIITTYVEDLADFHIEVMDYANGDKVKQKEFITYSLEVLKELSKDGDALYTDLLNEVQVLDKTIA